MKRLLTLSLFLLPAGAAVVLAGCGGGSGGGTAAGYGGAAKTASPTTGGATVALRPTKLGNALVTADGRTLYLFEQDKSPSSTCNGACASLWPPLTTKGKPRAGTGVDPAKLGTTQRKDGSTEVTYAGHPLYRYAPDAKAGDVHGQGLDQFGAEWYVLAASGRKIDEH
jgi:predicted lipoprotein with Yx(FWY)xxD motif